MSDLSVLRICVCKTIAFLFAVCVHTLAAYAQYLVWPQFRGPHTNPASTLTHCQRFKLNALFVSEVGKACVKGYVTRHLFDLVEQGKGTLRPPGRAIFTAPEAVG